jgi:hypothetical protein
VSPINWAPYERLRDELAELGIELEVADEQLVEGRGSRQAVAATAVCVSARVAAPAIPDRSERG